MSGQSDDKTDRSGAVDPVSGHTEADTPVIGHAASFAPGASVPWHSHERGQLALTLSRVMRVETPDRVWLVPRGSVLWLPAGTPHRSIAPEERLMRSLYVRPEAPTPLPGTPTAVEQGTPLADMVTWLAETYDTDRLDRAWSTVADAALALVRPSAGISVRMQRPRDPKVAVLADALMADPSDETDLTEWGERLGTSARTLRRRIQAETGMSYRDWRRYLALSVAAERLMAGGSVTDVAFEVGFSSASSFIASFKATFQITPGDLRRRVEMLEISGFSPEGISGSPPDLTFQIQTVPSASYSGTSFDRICRVWSSSRPRAAASSASNPALKSARSAVRGAAW